MAIPTRRERHVRRVANRLAKTISQVALNWLLCKDELIIPIPGCTGADHVLENSGALNWQLSADDFAALEQASAPWKSREPG